MPADYNSAAQALSLPISPIERSSSAAADPPWIRTSRQPNSHRLSTPYSRGDNSPSFMAQVLQTTTKLMNRGLKLFYSLTPSQRLAAIGAGIVLFAIAIVMLIFSHRIFAALEPVAESWRKLPGGWIIIGLMTAATAFPPIIGYSTCVTIAGFVFGFPGGWPIVASATVLGSTAAFLTSRTVFSAYVDRLVGNDKRFVALGQVLRHDGLLVLAGIRLCPLPFSLSNGFLATIPSINPWTFALATGLATPKLLVHVFIGSRLALLAESGDQMTGFDKFVNYVSMMLFGVVGIVIGLVVYRRTMARAKELALEEVAENGRVVPGDSEYDDLEEGVAFGVGRGGRSLNDEDPDAAALMDDDDISLWETDGVVANSGVAAAGGYTDDDDDEHVKKGVNHH